MTEIAATGEAAVWSAGAQPGAGWARPDARRILQLALAGIWMLDAVLQYQSFMFTKAFGQMIGATSAGNPGVIAGPINWNASLVEHHAVVLNAVFATIQLAIALAIAWRPTTKAGLGASVAWSLGVWWFGEGLGAILTGTASPVNGAPGAVLIYAIIAVLLWPQDRQARPPYVAARAVGLRAAQTIWLVFWAAMVFFTLQPANLSGQSLHDMAVSMADGEPSWLASLERGFASLVAHQGATAGVLLAAAFAVIAVSVFLPARTARAAIVLALVVSAFIWLFGQALGGLLTGGGTDPNSGPLLALLALLYWPGLGMRPAHPAAAVTAAS
jgi:hypothetical protein